MPTTVKQDHDFISAMISGSLLEDAIKWINENLSPEEVCDDKQLKAWADNAGYEQVEQ